MCNRVPEVLVGTRTRVKSRHPVRNPSAPQAQSPGKVLATLCLQAHNVFLVRTHVHSGAGICNREFEVLPGSTESHQHSRA